MLSRGTKDLTTRTVGTRTNDSVITDKSDLLHYSCVEIDRLLSIQIAKEYELQKILLFQYHLEWIIIKNSFFITFSQMMDPES